MRNSRVYVRVCGQRPGLRRLEHRRLLWLLELVGVRLRCALWVSVVLVLRRRLRLSHLVHVLLEYHRLLARLLNLLRLLKLVCMGLRRTLRVGVVDVLRRRLGLSLQRRVLLEHDGLLMRLVGLLHIAVVTVHEGDCGDGAKGLAVQARYHRRCQQRSAKSKKEMSHTKRRTQIASQGQAAHLT